MPLKLHFLNVGQGDCTIIEFPSGRIGIVDIDNLKILDKSTRAEVIRSYRESREFLLKMAGTNAEVLLREKLRQVEEKLTDPLAYYDIRIGADRDIFRFIATHPDMDHITGLHRLSQDNRKTIVNFWHIGHDDFNLKEQSAEDWEQGRYDIRDWETYKKFRKSASDPKGQEKLRGVTGQYEAEDGVQLWAPTNALVDLAVERDAPNIASMILLITYQGRRIVLGGDATGAESWSAIYSDTNMTNITVLKASHHGRLTGYHQLSVKEMSPWLTITSVEDEEHDATPRYRQYSNRTVSLRKAGDITVTVADDGKWYISSNAESVWNAKLDI
jgi:beta-lactamase superfamily II metal-dependent hydrolase